MQQGTHLAEMSKKMSGTSIKMLALPRRRRRPAELEAQAQDCSHILIADAVAAAAEEEAGAASRQPARASQLGELLPITGKNLADAAAAVARRMTAAAAGERWGPLGQKAACLQTSLHRTNLQGNHPRRPSFTFFLKYPPSPSL